MNTDSLVICAPPESSEQIRVIIRSWLTGSCLLSSKDVPTLVGQIQFASAEHILPPPPSSPLNPPPPSSLVASEKSSFLRNLGIVVKTLTHHLSTSSNYLPLSFQSLEELLTDESSDAKEDALSLAIEYRPFLDLLSSLTSTTNKHPDLSYIFTTKVLRRLTSTSVPAHDAFVFEYYNDLLHIMLQLSDAYGAKSLYLKDRSTAPLLAGKALANLCLSGHWSDITSVFDVNLTSSISLLLQQSSKSPASDDDGGISSCICDIVSSSASNTSSSSGLWKRRLAQQVPGLLPFVIGRLLRPPPPPPPFGG